MRLSGDPSPLCVSLCTVESQFNAGKVVVVMVDAAGGGELGNWDVRGWVAGAVA